MNSIVDRCRALFDAWTGPPLSPAQVAHLVGLPNDKPLKNTLIYMRKRGELDRPMWGQYCRAKGE